MKILKEQKVGYDILHKYEGWRVAFITYSDRFDKREKNLLERHLYTDEVFILLKGKADLYVGEKGKRTAMKKGVAYLLKKCEWHSITLSKRSKIVVIENVETGKDNSEYMILNENSKTIDSHKKEE